MKVTDYINHGARVYWPNVKSDDTIVLLYRDFVDIYIDVKSIDALFMLWFVLSYPVIYKDDGMATDTDRLMQSIKEIAFVSSYIPVEIIYSIAALILVYEFNPAIHYHLLYIAQQLHSCQHG